MGFLTFQKSSVPSAPLMEGLKLILGGFNLKFTRKSVTNILGNFLVEDF